MAHRQYTAQFKANRSGGSPRGKRTERDRIGEQPESQHGAELEAEFLQKASTVFEDSKKEAREAKKKETAQRKETARMLKSVGQLALERDLLQDCFRRKGRDIPEFDPDRF